MDRPHAQPHSVSSWVAMALILGLALASGGCAPLLATGIYVWQGGNVVPPECDALEGRRVVVVCRPPSSHEYRHAGASRSIAREVSKLLVDNVPKIDVVNPREVDNWIDQQDWGDFRELADAVDAELVVHIELHDFELYKGKTLYQGRADATVTVHDVTDQGGLVWEQHLGEILYPAHSGIPAQDKPVQQFQREFVEIASQAIAQHFYQHDPNALFAMDALANR